MTGRSLRAAANLIDATDAADGARVRRVLAGLDRAAADEVIADLLHQLNLWMGGCIVGETDGHPDDHVTDLYLAVRVRQETDLMRRAAAMRDRDAAPTAPRATEEKP